MIARCACWHAYQDARYGPGRRVHNPCKYGKAARIGSGMRCTVCGAVKGTGVVPAAKPKENTGKGQDQ